MMFIYACTVILTAICEVIAVDQKDYAPNVGTVLFTAADLKKKQWSKSELALLKARRHFQTLLPPPVFINNFNEDYVNILLGYFKDAYTAIKREAPDTETDTIMTTALSDAIGGYLKVWVLPVAKLDYYGGTVSQNNVVKLFKFYNEIKRYLDTDGVGWREPDERVLNSMTINVAPLKIMSNTRSMKDPCDNLAYFEKTDTGLAIPIPNVNWNERASTMFIPLKNTSLIPMNTPDSAHNLVKYYDAAKNCIQSSNPKEQEKFDEKFQEWLARDVVPHLKDENLYLALGSVLSLVNRTRDLCNSVIDLYGNKYVMCKKPPSHALVDLSCKKMWIISIILLIEVAWCIPALIYILCSKRFRKKDCTSNVYLFIDNNKGGKGVKAEKKGKGYFKGTTSCMVEDTYPLSQDRPHSTTLSRDPEVVLFRRSQLTNMEFEGQLPESKMAKNIGIGSLLCLPSDPIVNKISREIPKQFGVIEKKSSLKRPTQYVYPDRYNSMQHMNNSSSYDQGISCSSKYTQSDNSVTTVRYASKNLPPDRTSFDYRNRKRCDYRRCDDRRKSEECCQVSEVRGKRSQNEQRRFEDLQKAEERKKLEEWRRAEEHKKAEERRRAEECKKLEERKRAEECKKQEERRRLEELKKQEEHRRAEEFKKLEERKRAEEYKKLEERRKAEERKQLEDIRKAEESKKLEESRKAEERKIAEERKKAEELKKLEEREKAEEYKKLEELRVAEERRAAEERRIAEEQRIENERKLAEEHKIELRFSEERRKPEECRLSEEFRIADDRKKAEEFKKLEERIKAEESLHLDEFRNNENRRHTDEPRMFEDSRRFEECRMLEKQDDCKTLEEYRMLEKLEECRSLGERIKAEEYSRRRKLFEDQTRKYEEFKKYQERMEREQSSKKLEEQNEEQKDIEEFRRQRKAEHSRKNDERKKPEDAKTFDEYKKLMEARQLDESRKQDNTKKYDETRNYDEARKRDTARNPNECRKYEEIRKFEESDKPREQITGRKPEDIKNLESYRDFDNRRQLDAQRHNNKDMGGSKVLDSLTNLYSGTKIQNDFRKTEDRRDQDRNSYNTMDNCGVRGAYSDNIDNQGAKDGSYSSSTGDQITRDSSCKNTSDRGECEHSSCNKIGDKVARNESYYNKRGEREVRVTPCCCHKADDRVARDCCCARPEYKKHDHSCSKRNEDRKKRDHSCSRKTKHRKERDDSIYLVENQRGREESPYLRTTEEINKKDSMPKESTHIVNEVKFENLNRKSSDYVDYNSPLADSRDTITDELQRSSYPCTECIDSLSTSTYRDVTSDSLSKYLSDKPLERERKTRFEVTKERMMPGNRGKSKNKVKVKTGKSPYLEITIDRPTTEICVDMGQCKSHYSSFKPSKIPKRASIQPFHSRQGSDPTEKQKSLIPQPKRKTLDDITLAQCGCSKSCDTRLNDTF